MKTSKTASENLFEFTNALVPARRAWMQAANHVVSEFGIPSVLAMALIHVARTGESGIRQNALAEEVGINRGAMVRLVDQAAEAGLLERLEDSTDGRVRIIHALPDGKALAAKLESLIAELREEILGDADFEEIEEASRLMRHFSARINNFLQAKRID